MTAAPGRRTIHLLTGCTATGKTAAAARWAERAEAEILSCDALLFYRGMDIGTAKPSAEERARVPHHLVDVLEVTQVMDVARYAALAREAAEGIVARGRSVLAVGGSGFYLKVFFGSVADDVDVPAAVRAGVEARYQAGGLGALVAELRALNPEGLGKLDQQNPRRVVRALERCVASGKTLAELAEAFAHQPAPFAGWTVKLAELARPPEILERRIGERTRGMIASGLVEEADRLLVAGLKGNPTAARAIGYREVIAMREGRVAAADLEREIIRSTRALVKKQRTWFRTQLPEHPILSGEPADPPAGWFEPR